MQTVHRMRSRKHATWSWNAGRHTLSHDHVANKTGLLPGVSMHIIEHWHAIRCLVTFTDSKRNLSQRPQRPHAEWTPGDVQGQWCGIALIRARMPLELDRGRPAAVRARTVLEDRGGRLRELCHAKGYFSPSQHLSLGVCGKTLCERATIKEMTGRHGHWRRHWRRYACKYEVPDRTCLLFMCVTLQWISLESKVCHLCASFHAWPPRCARV